MASKPRVKLWSRRKGDFNIQFFKGTGPGGQHRNKRETACRITDKETSLSAESQEFKSQEQNKKAAFRKLVDKLTSHYNKVFAPEPTEKTTEVTRTYNKVDDRVVDHVTGRRYSYRETVERKDISQLVEDRVKHRLEEKLKE